MKMKYVFSKIKAVVFVIYFNLVVFFDGSEKKNTGNWGLDWLINLIFKQVENIGDIANAYETAFEKKLLNDVPKISFVKYVLIITALFVITVTTFISFLLKFAFMSVVGQLFTTLFLLLSGSSFSAIILSAIVRFGFSILTTKVFEMVWTNPFEILALSIFAFKYLIEFFKQYKLLLS